MLEDSLLLRHSRFVHQARATGEVLLVFDLGSVSEDDVHGVIKDFLQSGYGAKEVVRSVVVKTLMVPTTEPTTPTQGEVN